MHIIELRGLLHPSADVNDSSDLRGITGPGDVAAPSHVHVDSLGNAYVTNDDSRLQSTGGLMLHIPANALVVACLMHGELSVTIIHAVKTLNSELRSNSQHLHAFCMVKK